MACAPLVWSAAALPWAAVGGERLSCGDGGGAERAHEGERVEGTAGLAGSSPPLEESESRSSRPRAEAEEIWAEDCEEVAGARALALTGGSDAGTVTVGRSGTVMTGCSSGTARDTGAVKAKDGSETSEGAMATAEGARARAAGETREDSWELTG